MKAVRIHKTGGPEVLDYEDFDLPPPAPDQAFGRFGEQLLAGPVHQAQELLAVERKNRDIDLDHHFAQQRGGLESAEALLAQGATHGIHLLHDFAERVVNIRSTRPHRKIAFLQRGQ